MPQISPKSLVSETAELAEDVAVGPFSYIGPEVRLDAGCVIQNNVSLVGKTTLGQGCVVFPLAVIGVPAPGEAEGGQCILGEANAIREHVTICAGLEAPTRIGNHNLIMIASQIGAGATVGDHGIFDNYSRIGAGAVVEDYVRTSGFAVIADGNRLGAYSFVAAFGSVVHDGPPYAMLQGSPVRVRGVNTRNLKACGFGGDDIQALKRAFRELFNGPENQVNPKVLLRLASRKDLNPYVRKLVEAVRSASANEADDD